MGSDNNRTKIGPKVDERVYERFVNHVEEKHGMTRGVLGMEVENALRRYMEVPEDERVLSKVSRDLDVIKDAVGAEADGGRVVADEADPAGSDAAHTHTESVCTNDDIDTDEVPHKKASKADKADYIFDAVTVDVDGLVVNANVFRKKISDTWGFGDRATGDIIRQICDRYHAKAVRKADDDMWSFAVGRTEQDRDEALGDFAGDEDIEVLNDASGSHAVGAKAYDAAEG